MTNDAYKATELHRRQLFLERTNNAFAAPKIKQKGVEGRAGRKGRLGHGAS